MLDLQSNLEIHRRPANGRRMKSANGALMKSSWSPRTPEVADQASKRLADINPVARALETAFCRVPTSRALNIFTDSCLMLDSERIS